MDDIRVGLALRAVRRRDHWRQLDVARRARVSRETVSRLERGGLGRYPLDTLRVVTASLGMRLDVSVRWRGGDLDRVLNAMHAALHEAVARHLASRPGWEWAPEVSFSIYGERGVIDILAWHAATRSLLVIELKTDLVDPQELAAVMDRRVRLGPQIARQRGWQPRSVSAWVVVIDSATNRRRLARHGRLLKAAFPSDGRTVRGWLRRPAGSIMALSFWSDVTAGAVRSDIGQVRRVRKSVAPVSGALAERGRAGRRTDQSSAEADSRSADNDRAV